MATIEKKTLKLEALRQKLVELQSSGVDLKSKEAAPPGHSLHSNLSLG